MRKMQGISTICDYSLQQIQERFKKSQAREVSLPMKLERPVRLGGLAALAAGALLFLSELVRVLPLYLLPFWISGAELSILGWGGINLYLGALIALLVQLGLVGLYASQARHVGVLGGAGFLISFIGGRLALGPSFADPIASPSTWWAVGRGLWWLLALYTLVFVLGWVLFGVATLRAGIYPRAASALLIAGTLALLLPLPLSGVIFAVALAWMGYTLFTQRAEEAAQAHVRGNGDEPLQ
jgi:hypothetical protein